MEHYPTQLDEIDQWLVDNFGIMPGDCSSTENLRHNIARMVAEALWPKDKTIQQDTDYVDLGLPSGTKWASCNVGATKPEEYGEYYTFDEVQKLGVIVPTKEQWDELIHKCTWLWTTQNGVNGYLVTGHNGNSIFLPAAGYRRNSSLYRAGTTCDYWSSSLDTAHPDDAYVLRFYSNYVFRSNYRYYGRSVRAVSK